MMESAELHIIIAATHTFDKTLMDTAIQDNVNPIERVERFIYFDSRFLAFSAGHLATPLGQL